MNYEVEQKFPVEDLAVIERRLARLGATFGPPIQQVDCYFAHPARDFAHTDEALRIRSVGEHNFLTYKGPKLDPVTKTRREIERPIEDGPLGAAGMAELLEALGFRPVAEVRKRRRPVAVAWHDWHISGALDEVTRLGTFVELEIVTEPQDLDAARQAVVSLAAELDLTLSERRSYLELLLERAR